MYRLMNWKEKTHAEASELYKKYSEEAPKGYIPLAFSDFLIWSLIRIVD